MLGIPKQGTMVEHPEPHFPRLSAVVDPTTELKLEKVDNLLPHGTLETVVANKGMM